MMKNMKCTGQGREYDFGWWNHKKWEGRRQFEESDECILKVIVVNGKLVFTGKKQVVDVCSQKFSNRSRWQQCLTGSR